MGCNLGNQRILFFCMSGIPDRFHWEHYQFVKVETILNHPRKRRTSFPRTYNVIPANAGIQSIDIYLHTSHAIRSSSLLSVLISMPFSIF